MFERGLSSLLHDSDLNDKLLIVSGPRQVGKTFLSQKWLSEKSCEDLYFNWDDEKTRRQHRQDPHFFESLARQKKIKPRIVFDEIHKISQWKTLLKGYYDRFKSDFDFLVTGSARLEMFNRSGDSMLGRYHLLHLNPLLPHEVYGKRKKIKVRFSSSAQNMLHYLEESPLPQDIFTQLWHFSGFPAPLMKGSQRALRLWQREYRQRLIREDLRDLTRIHDLTRAEHLFDLLPQRVGSPLSLNSLREDLICSHDAVSTLISAFEKMAVIFSIRPYSRRIQNSLHKEPKIYFYDWSQIQDEGKLFENWMAVFLKTWCDMVNDGGWGDVDLFYIRDKQKREVDFLITHQKTPLVLVEAKVAMDSSALKHLCHFADVLKVPLSLCVTKEEKIFKKPEKNIAVVSANRFANLFWSYS